MRELVDIMIRRFLKDERGTNTVELTFISISLLLLTLGVVDVGRVMVDWNATQKAAQLGANEAMTRDPIVVPLKYYFFCNPPTDAALVGASCSDDNGNLLAECNFGTYTCDSTGCTGANTASYNTAQASQETFDAIVAAMQNSLPGLQPENVQVSYSTTGLGFIGMPGSPPAEVMVTVSDIPFNFVALAPFGDLMSGITMPPMRATFTGEDLSNNSCQEQGLTASNPDANGVFICQSSGNKKVEAPTPVCF